MNALQKNQRLLFFGLWLLLGLLQAGLTELQDDEAYYWVYSRYLDWGYFDHPPMIAVLVKMGYAIFPNALGVRLFPLLLNIFSLVIIERLTRKKDAGLFYVIALSIAVLQVAGFIAVPDIPLIFFTALFFWCYQRFLERNNWSSTLLLAFSVAFLLYSKYHAVLIILFVLLSNLKLFTNYRLYIAGVLALTLFLPHLWWQYQHDWVSFRYHLFESNVNPYRPSFTIAYIGGQLLLPGPIAGFILLPAAFFYRPEKTSPGYFTIRALRFTLIGIYVFFLLSSFRGKVEGNWTSPVLVPLMVLSHQYLADHQRWRKWLVRLLPVTLLLVLFARVIMIADILPVKAVRERYHSWAHWPSQLREKTRGLPIVFSNSYQRASKYWFYSGQMTYSQNIYKGRRNNFNFWPIEDSMLGKPVYLVDIYGLDRFADSIQTPIGWIGYRYDSSFASFAKLTVMPTLNYQNDGNLVIDATTTAPAAYLQYIKNHPGLPATVGIALFNTQGWIKDLPTSLTLEQLISGPVHLTVRPELPKGHYFLRFAVGVGVYYPTHNSEKIPFVVP